MSDIGDVLGMLGQAREGLDEVVKLVAAAGEKLAEITHIAAEQTEDATGALSGVGCLSTSVIRTRRGSGAVTRSWLAGELPAVECAIASSRSPGNDALVGYEEEANRALAVLPPA